MTRISVLAKALVVRYMYERGGEVEVDEVTRFLESLRLPGVDPRLWVPMLDCLVERNGTKVRLTERGMWAATKIAPWVIKRATELYIPVST